MGFIENFEVSNLGGKNSFLPGSNPASQQSNLSRDSKKFRKGAAHAGAMEGFRKIHQEQHMSKFKTGGKI